MNKEFDLHRMDGLPPLALSWLNSLSIKTGTWRYLRPVFHQKTAPCHDACPAGEDIAAWIQLLNEEKLEEAYNLIREENPFPGVCGRVCYHPCEAVCNRGQFDEVIQIHLLERFLADLAFRYRFPQPTAPDKKSEKVAIVGAGPAGLSCAYHLARMGYRVTVYEASPDAGGVLRNGIPKYRLPRETLNYEIELIEKLGVNIETDVNVGVSLKMSELEDYDAVFIATGAPEGLKLNVPGEDLEGVVSGLDFLSLVNRGELRSLEGKIAIIGGGNTAIDAARSVLRLGAEPMILYRRSKQEMPAFADEIKEAQKEKIEIKYQASPTRIIGKGGRVEGLECVKMQLSGPDASGRRRPLPIAGSHFTLDVDRVITAIGEVPNISFLYEDIKTHNQLILTDSNTSTQKKGVFAGGDVVSQPRTVVHAIASGKIGAMAIDQHIQRTDLRDLKTLIGVGETRALSMKRYLERFRSNDERIQKIVGFESINLDYFSKIEPAETKGISSSEGILGFDEVNMGLSDKIASQISRRCFNCGLCNSCGNCLVFCPDIAVSFNDRRCPEINYDYCKGCGICAVECPRGIITMTEEEQ